MSNDIKNKIEKSYNLIDIKGNEIQKTLFFNIGKKEILPGQFFMLNYNISQRPFSVSHYDGNIIGFTIMDRGECSKNMLQANIGDYFGLTGPLGSYFKIKSEKSVLLVGGGIGIAPIYFLANSFKNKNIKIDILFGARNIKNFEFSFDLDLNVSYYTDDGSYGKKGFVTMDLEDIIGRNNYDALYLCGPEKMMVKVIEIAKKRIKNIQLSMERYMKCGVGLCGSCVLDDIGLRVCEEGPVFSYFDTIINCKEFGVYHRDQYGRIEK